MLLEVYIPRKPKICCRIDKLHRILVPLVFEGEIYVHRTQVNWGACSPSTPQSISNVNAYGHVICDGFDLHTVGIWRKPTTRASQILA